MSRRPHHRRRTVFRQLGFPFGLVPRGISFPRVFWLCDVRAKLLPHSAHAQERSTASRGELGCHLRRDRIVCGVLPGNGPVGTLFELHGALSSVSRRLRRRLTALATGVPFGFVPRGISFCPKRCQVGQPVRPVEPNPHSRRLR